MKKIVSATLLVTAVVLGCSPFVMATPSLQCTPTPPNADVTVASDGTVTVNPDELCRPDNASLLFTMGSDDFMFRGTNPISFDVPASAPPRDEIECMAVPPSGPKKFQRVVCTNNHSRTGIYKYTVHVERRSDGKAFEKDPFIVNR